MSLGKAPDTEDLSRSARALCEPKPQASSLDRLLPLATACYRLLAEQGSRRFADERFADLFQQVGRDSDGDQAVGIGRAAVARARVRGSASRRWC